MAPVAERRQPRGEFGAKMRVNFRTLMVAVIDCQGLTEAISYQNLNEIEECLDNMRELLQRQNVLVLEAREWLRQRIPSRSPGRKEDARGPEGEK